MKIQGVGSIQPDKSGIRRGLSLWLVLTFLGAIYLHSGHIHARDFAPGGIQNKQIEHSFSEECVVCSQGSSIQADREKSEPVLADPELLSGKIDQYTSILLEILLFHFHKGRSPPVLS